MGNAKNKGKRLRAEKKKKSNAKFPFYKSPVFRFVLKLLIPITLFYVLYDTGFYERYIFSPYANLHATITGFFLSLFGQQVVVSGPTVSSNLFSIIIVRGCDAIEPALIFTAAVFAFPAPLRAKMKGILVGIPAIHIINLTRIISLFFVGAYYPDFFDIAHLKWWQALFIMIVIAGWGLWLHYAVIRNKKVNTYEA